MKLYIIRGLPSSGKTTLAEQLAPGYVYAADDFFETKAKAFGITYNEAWARYKSSIPFAHETCRLNVEKAMKENVSSIAVTNIFALKKDFKPYIDLADIYSYDVVLLTVERCHNGKNNHDVPFEIIDRTYRKWQNYDNRIDKFY